METKKLVVLGFGARGKIYAGFAEKYPEKFNLVAVIENDKVRLEDAKKLHPSAKLFSDYHDFLAANIKADVVAICTQDKDHKEHAISMMAAGYDLLLEKPIANNKKDCIAIYKASQKYARKVIVCHVLRYSRFYSKIKELIDSGALGEVVTIHASENVGYFHQAHSFVRGPWRNKEQSSPMILAKCCHDMDIIRYLMGEPCVSVNSYGDLLFFNREHAPKDSAEYCSECKVKDCVYRAQDVYLSLVGSGDGFLNYFLNGKEPTAENILSNLKRSQYDRCVFKCDNDVVDHEVTIMNFRGNKTACHTMTAFSRSIYRDIKVFGTKAELTGIMENNKITVNYFGGKSEEIQLDVSGADVGMHNGSDFFMMNALYKDLNGERAKGITYLDVSIESHLMSFAAEESRLHNGKTVKVKK